MSNEERNPDTVRNRRSENWTTLPVILGAAAVIVIGVWFYVDREEANPVAPSNAPANTPTPNK